MIFGEERLFITENPANSQGFVEFFLRYDGQDQHGLKMKGIFPKNIWKRKQREFQGPLLYDEDKIYTVTWVDETKNRLWLRRVF